MESINHKRPARVLTSHISSLEKKMERVEICFFSVFFRGLFFCSFVKKLSDSEVKLKMFDFYPFSFLVSLT